MRTLLIATTFALALPGCSQPEAPADLEQIEEGLDNVAEASDGPTAVDGGPVTGDFTTVDSEGSEAIWTLSEDGTFTLAANGLDPVTGTYTHEDSEHGAVFCAEPDGADVGTLCWDLSRPGEDGRWTATAEDGSVLTVNRVDNTAN